MQWNSTGDLWISNPSFYHSVMVTSAFHLWQFQVFNSSAEGMMVVFLAWTCERFLSACNMIQVGTSGSLVLHSTTMPWWLLVLMSDNLRYLPLVQSYWQWYCSDGSFGWFLFTATGIELGSTRFLNQHSTNVPLRLLVFPLWKFLGIQL